MSALADVFSPENIARSRARAAKIRSAVDRGELGAEWLDIAADIETGADEREMEARTRA